MHEILSRTVAMKESLREKFKQNVNFVRPLYRKVKFGNRVKPARKILVTVDVNHDKPCGDGIYVKREIVRDNSVDYNVVDLNSENEVYEFKSPGACDSVREKTVTRFAPIQNVNNFRVKGKLRHDAFTKYKLPRLAYGKMDNQKHFDTDQNDCVEGHSRIILKHEVPISWLRVYPAPQTHDESTAMVIFRCMVCQLGLAAFLILWTLLWVFVLQHFEGPYEEKVSLEFEKAQNQLVIDLATELRQITPLSPKWRHAIEQRLEDERRLSIEAVSRGAKLHPGQFWDLSGTFLFTVYVMTALGFGAPIPRTPWGRTSALLYAALAVPLHIFLMVNACTCIVFKIDKFMERWKANRANKKIIPIGKNAEENKESPDYSKNLEQTRKSICWRPKLTPIFNILHFGHGMPVATVLYYAVGVISFGVLRGRTSLEAAMFPLEFTTTGGLEHVEGIVRVTYGLYVEGAMTLLACTLATLRAHTSSSFGHVVDRNRLFVHHHT